MKRLFRECLTTISAIFLILTFNGCSKEVDPEVIDSNYFIHVYPKAGNQWSNYIMPLQDGNFSILAEDDIDGTGDKMGLISLIVNPKGELISTHTLTDSVWLPQITRLKDGSLIFNSLQRNAVFGKINANGTMAFTTKFSNSGFQLNAAPIETKDGKYYLTSSCNGGSQGAPSNNRIYGIDQSGKYLGFFEIPDSSFKTKCLWFSVYKSDSLGDYYGVGSGFPNWKGNWDAEQRLFIFHYRYDNDLNLISKQKYDIPYSNDGYRQDDFYYIHTTDNYLIVGVTQRGKNDNTRGVVYQFDDDLNLIWERQLQIGSQTTYIENVFETPDKNYLINGTVKNVNKTLDQPFAVKMNRDGQIIWSRIYPTSLNGSIKHAIETLEGNTLLTGSTAGFGKGASASDIILFKTDKKGTLY